MEADVSARHEWLQAFGCPMYFQAKSPCFMPNIQRQYQRYTISIQGPANASFYPDPFQMPMHAKISFACLGKHSYRQMYLTCNLFFFLIRCTHFTLLSFHPIPPRLIFICNLKPVLSLCAFTSHKIYNATLSSLISKLKKETSSKLNLSRCLKVT